MKKIIVTGGSGFIGSNLIQLLLKKKYFVINIDKSSYSANPYNVKDFKKNRNYLFYKLDITHKNRIIKILKKHKPIGIFNLAAETHVDRSIDRPKPFINTNINGTFNLLECLRELKRETNIKLIHISTDEVYGDIKNNLSDYNYLYPHLDDNLFNVKIIVKDIRHQNGKNIEFIPLHKKIEKEIYITWNGGHYEPVKT